MIAKGAHDSIVRRINEDLLPTIEREIELARSDSRVDGAIEFGDSLASNPTQPFLSPS